MRCKYQSAVAALCALILASEAALLADDVVHLDLSAEAWQLSNSNQSVAVTTTLPAHVLGVLAAAGVVQQDPLYRYGELETRWVSNDSWNFTLIWPGVKHQQVAACGHVLLLLQGVDTFGDVLLNGRHVLKTNNAHRSWWVELPPNLLRDGANMLSVVLQPAVSTALRAKALNRYALPTMAVPGGFDVYNFARKPASDFGWDWGPAFAPAGITGPLQLVGFNRAAITGALVHQQLINSTTFLLHITVQLLVPADGDSGLLTVQLPQLHLQQQQQVTLTAGAVAGNPLQALAHMKLQVSADKVDLWQPRGLLLPGATPALYDVVITFQPAPAGDAAAAAVSDTDDSGTSSSFKRRIGFRTVELVRVPIQEAAAELLPKDPSSSSSSSRHIDPKHAALFPGATASSPTAEAGTWAQVQGLWRYMRNVTDRPTWWHPQEPPGRDWPAPSSTQPETVRAAVQAECDSQRSKAIDDNDSQFTHCRRDHEIGVNEAMGGANDGGSSSSGHCQQQACESIAAAAGSSAAGQRQSEDGESFYFKVNGVPVYAKGANLIPLHVLSSAVTADDVVLLLQSAAAANMNMIRIWGGGLYQVDELYSAADELGLMVWQEAMFACSPYPRDPAFLSSVESEVMQQVLRLGSHPSVVLWGGNNEIEAALDWFDETRSNPALFAVDYDLLFEQTVGRVVQEMLPGVPWVDSSPSNGYITLGDNGDISSMAPATPAQQGHAADAPSAQATAADGSPSAGPGVVVKRWGNPQNPKYGDVHYYNYRDNCQDWRTYPASRFISEYGWQSYPSWATYSAATEPQDWTLSAAMTEYRQRHPNGTIELLAQLNRRFKMPQAWQDTLNKYQQQQRQQQDTQHQGSWCNSSNTSDLWKAFCAKILDSLLQLWHSLMKYATHLPSRTLSSSSSSDGGSAKDSFTQGVDQSDSHNEIEHWIYLTQLQQLLCYDAAVSYWRRLRSQANTLTMGILYWQLNDIWQGASWSSIDYAGVWKPLHYQLARAFADLSLSVQHNFHNNTLQVHVVSDLQETVEAQLTVRLLSLSDSSASCHSGDASSSSSSSTLSSLDKSSNQRPERTLQEMQKQKQQAMEVHDPSQAAMTTACKAPWPRGCQTVSLHVPPRSSVQGFSGSITLLLAAAPGCSSSTCYIHIGLEAPGQVAQEATVWLAPFSEMQLPDPKLQLSGFKLVHVAGQTSNAISSSRSSEAAGATATTTTAAAPSTVGVSSEEFAFSLSSERVAVHTVLELQSGYHMPGHFSNNAVTLHPCEPRQVRFVPHLGASSWQSYLARLDQRHQQQHRQGSGDADSGGTSQVAGLRSVTMSLEPAYSADHDGFEVKGLRGLLQHQLIVTSLYEHQLFGPTSKTISSAA